MFYLICYDIADNRRRNKVSQMLEGHGMRVQYSVFECVLEDKERVELERRLTKQIDLQEDQVRFYPLSERNRNKVNILGLQPVLSIDDKFYIF